MLALCQLGAVQGLVLFVGGVESLVEQVAVCTDRLSESGVACDIRQVEAGRGELGVAIAPVVRIGRWIILLATGCETRGYPTIVHVDTLLRRVVRLPVLDREGLVTALEIGKR